MGGRFLNKRFTVQDGFSQGPGDDSPFVEFNATRRLHSSDGIAVGSGQDIVAIFRTVYTWNIPAIVPGTGSVNSRVAQDVVVTGAAVGDPILIAPIGSLDAGLTIFGACYSAGVVNLRAEFTGTTGAYTPGNVPVKIVDISI